MKKWLIELLVTVTLISVIISLVLIQHNTIESNNRLRDNYSSIVSKSNDRVLKITKKELKAYMIENDSLLARTLRENKIKINKVERIINNHYEHTYSEKVKLVHDTLYPDISEFTYQPDSCLYLHAKIGIDSVDVDSLYVNYESTTVVWKRRVGKRGNRTVFPFGHLRTYSSTYNNCRGETSTKEIEIVKR